MGLICVFEIITVTIITCSFPLSLSKTATERRLENEAKFEEENDDLPENDLMSDFCLIINWPYGTENKVYCKKVTATFYS